MSQHLQIYFIHSNFLTKPTKKITIEPESYTAMLPYLFSILQCLIAQKKWKLESGPRLQTLRYTRAKFHASSSLHQHFSSMTAAFRVVPKTTLTIYVFLNNIRVRREERYSIVVVRLMETFL